MCLHITRLIYTCPFQLYSDPRVTQRIKELLVNWVNEFRNDSNMSPLVRFVEQLKKDGISFPGLRQPAAAPNSSVSAVQVE